ncbi:MAG TPA: hypothetical protein VHF47_08805 [Acidimicrobiales bacterium]|nr:hypothetical protein [Acidimicrobiales bacterium]
MSTVQPRVPHAVGGWLTRLLGAAGIVYGVVQAGAGALAAGGEGLRSVGGVAALLVGVLVVLLSVLVVALGGAILTRPGRVGLVGVGVHAGLLLLGLSQGIRDPLFAERVSFAVRRCGTAPCSVSFTGPAAGETTPERVGAFAVAAVAAVALSALVYAGLRSGSPAMRVVHAAAGLVSVVAAVAVTASATAAVERADEAARERCAYVLALEDGVVEVSYRGTPPVPAEYHRRCNDWRSVAAARR